MINIAQADDSRIELYRNLKDISFTHSEKNLFIAEGLITAKKLLQSNIEIMSFFALPEFYDIFSELIQSKNISKSNQFTSEKNVMNQIVGFRLHQGIMAIGKTPEQTPINKMKPPIVVLNGIVNSENVGAIVRNAVAFSIKSIIFDKRTSHPYLRRAVRVSMGTVFSIQYYHSNNIIKDLAYLKNEKGYELIASEISKSSIPINEHLMRKKTAIIFGSEGKGISNDILSICNKVIHIPIAKEVESLNVAASSSIIFNYLYKNL